MNWLMYSVCQEGNRDNKLFVRMESVSLIVFIPPDHMAIDLVWLIEAVK
jgi:hypothetical protein